MEKYKEGEERLRPDIITFNSVLAAWATQHKAVVNERSVIDAQKEPLLRAESLFKEMHRLNYLSPCTISYNIMLDMYSSVPDLVKAESLFQEMLDRCRLQSSALIAPDQISYNILLKAMVNDADPKSIKKAQELLLAMEGFSEPSEVSHLASSIKPNIMSYNIFMRGLAAQNPDEAEEFLRSMITRYRVGLSLVRPGNITFNICIDAYGKRGNIGKAENLLNEMIALSKEWNEPDLMPDTIT
jgi:pentatricopeptide repeat protein